MKRFCAVLCAFVLVIVLGLPVAAEGINGSAADGTHNNAVHFSALEAVDDVHFPGTFPLGIPHDHAVSLALRLPDDCCRKCRIQRVGKVRK